MWKERFCGTANLFDIKLKLTLQVENLGKLLSNFEKLLPSISTDQSIQHLLTLDA